MVICKRACAFFCLCLSAFVIMCVHGCVHVLKSDDCLTCEWIGTSIIVRMNLMTLVQLFSGVLWYGWRMIMAITNNNRIEYVRVICVVWQVTHDYLPLIVIIVWFYTNHKMLEFYVRIDIEFLRVQFQKREHILLWDVWFVLVGNRKVRIAHQFFWKVGAAINTNILQMRKKMSTKIPKKNSFFCFSVFFLSMHIFYADLFKIGWVCSKSNEKKGMITYCNPWYMLVWTSTPYSSVPTLSV